MPAVAGVYFKLGSLQSLLSGSVEFATPDEAGPVAIDGAEFRLATESKGDWLKWAPHIELKDDAP